MFFGSILPTPWIHGFDSTVETTRVTKRSNARIFDIFFVEDDSQTTELQNVETIENVKKRQSEDESGGFLTRRSFCR